MRTTLLHLFLLTIALIPVQTRASVYVIKEWQPVYHLNEAFETMTSPPGNITIETIENQEFRKISDSFISQSHQTYWGNIQIQNQLVNASEHTEWVLTFSSSWTYLEVYIQQPDGSFKKETNGIFVPNSEKDYLPTSEGNLIKLSLFPDEILNIYFKGYSERESIPPRFEAKLQHSEAYHEDLRNRKISNAIFIGFVLMMFLYNMILYFFGRDNTYIFYSIYILTLAIYASFIVGDLADWFESWLFPNNPQFQYFGKLAIYIGLMSYIAFMRRFLDLKSLLPKWDKWFKYLFLLGPPLLVIDIILIFVSNFSYVISDVVTVFYIVLFVLMSMIFLFPLYKTKDKKGYFIVAGVGVMAFGFLMTAISRAASPNFPLLYFKIGTILEIIIFSLGLAYRQWESRQAKQEAEFELEKSKIIQAQKQAEAAQLKELDQFKNQLYTNLTHEFRTPLTVIMGMGEKIGGHEQEKDLILRNSANLLRLINQLLDLSKLESGKLSVNNIQSNIVSYVEYLSESLHSLAEEKGVRMTFYSEQSEIIMDYDEAKIQHIVYNLLSNAVKFTDKGGKVVLHLNRLDNARLKLKVSDSGKGIPDDKLPHIFDRFYQVDGSHTRKGEGTGIGLTLTKELVELMGGEISVKSELEVGTEFIVLLPITNKAPIQKTEIAHKPNDFPKVPESTEEHLIQSNEDAPSLLLIEDNPDVATYIKSILKNQYLVHLASDGEEGINKGIELIPDIIISDVMMPKKDGFEVCETLKQDERTSHIPIILLTAKSAQKDKIEGLKYGADAFLSKPFDKEELFVRLEQLVSLRKKLQNRYAQFGLQDAQVEVEEAPREPSLEDLFLEKLRTAVLENLSDPQFSPPQLAKKVLMSKMQVYRKLKAISNQTPSQFIRKIRLQKGLELLKTTDLNISEIAYDVGFNDPNYFSRTFHQEFGMNPSNYRS